jgi:hypothetical protein
MIPKLNRYLCIIKLVFRQCPRAVATHLLAGECTISPIGFRFHTRIFCSIVDSKGSGRIVVRHDVNWSRKVYKAAFARGYVSVLDSYIIIPLTTACI